MIPAGQASCSETTNDVRYYIVDIKVPAIGQEPLYEFRTNTKCKGTDQESEIKGPSARSVEYEVEAERKEEKGAEVEELVVGSVGR